MKIMKKLVLLLLVFSIVFANISFAGQKTATTKNLENSISVEKSGFFGKIDIVKEKISKSYEKIKKNLGGSLRTALLLMLVGILFLVLASVIGGGIVWTVGAIFFLIGAVLLLLYLL